METTFDKNSVEFWKSINRDSRITLTDIQTVKEDMSHGGGVDGVEFKVKHHRIFRIPGLAEYLFFNLVSDNMELWLVVWVIDGEDDLVFRLYYHDPHAIPQKNRKELIEDGFQWLFQEPKDVNNYQFTELIYADILTNDGLEFPKKEFGEFNGEIITPDEPILNHKMTTLVEYSATSECENPELIILEIGEGKDGGVVLFLQGYQINASDIEVLRD